MDKRYLTAFIMLLQDDGDQRNAIISGGGLPRKFEHGRRINHAIFAHMTQEASIWRLQINAKRIAYQRVEFDVSNCCIAGAHPMTE